MYLRASIAQIDLYLRSYFRLDQASLKLYALLLLGLPTRLYIYTLLYDTLSLLVIGEMIRYCIVYNWDGLLFLFNQSLAPCANAPSGVSHGSLDSVLRWLFYC